MRLTLKLKLIIALGSVVLLTAALGGVGIGTAIQIQRVITRLTQNTAPSLQNLEEIRSITYDIQHHLSPSFSEINYKLIIDSNSNVLLTYQKLKLTLQEKVAAYLRITEKSPEQFPLAQEIQELSKSLLIAANKAVKTTDAESLSAEKRNLNFQALRLVGATKLASEIELQKLKEDEALTGQVIKTVIRNYVIAVAIILLFAAILATTLAVRLAKPITDLNEAAIIVGHGQLGHKVPITSNDELGDLAHSFNQMSQSLQETTVSKDYMNNVLESMNELLVITDPNFIIEKINTAVTITTGLNSEKLIGDNLETLLSSSAYSAIQKLNEQTDKDQRISNLTTKCRRGDGSAFPALLSASRLLSGTDLMGYILVLRDISEQMQNNYELEGIKQRLDYAERMATLGTIGSILVHKLNQPLTAIQLFLQQSMRELKDTQNTNELLRQNLEDSLKEAVSISEIVKSMGTTSTSAAGQKESFNLASVINRVITILAPEADRGSATIQAAGLLSDYPFRGARIELEELFYIIIKNSIQAFKEPGGIINVTLKSEETQYMITIQDNGPGIAKDDIDHVFEMYFSTKGKDGCGLGLCIARQIIKNHNGELRLSSKQEKGTSIELILPFIAE